MIVEDLKLKPPADGTKAHWTFSLVLACGRGKVKYVGFRYYPDSGTVVSPKRRVGARYVSNAFVSTEALEDLRKLVEQAIEPPVTDNAEYFVRLVRLGLTDPAKRAALAASDLPIAARALAWLATYDALGQELEET